MREPDKHPAIFQTYDALSVGESFVLVTTTTPDTCARSSTPNTPAATAGNIGPNLDVLTHNADVQGSLAADPDGQTGKESGWLLIGVACAGAFVTLAVVGL